MELPPLPQNSLNSGDTARVPNAAALTKLLEVAVGETLSARVIQATLATEKQRDQLLQQLLSKHQPPGGTPGTKTQALAGQQTISQSLTQALAQAAYQGGGIPRQTVIPPAILSAIAKSSQDSQLLKLLQSPQLKLLEMTVKGKPVITYTDKAVSAGEHLMLKMAGTNRLTVIDTRLSQSAMKSTVDDSARAVVRDALRTALPNQQGLQKVLSALQQVHRLASPIKQAVVPPALQTGIQKVLVNLPSVNQLSKPAGVKQALQNSGVQLEAKLASQLSPKGREQLASQKSQAFIPSATTEASIKKPSLNLRTESAGIKPNITAPLRGQTTAMANPSPKQMSATLSGDVKSNLLNALTSSTHSLGKPLAADAQGLDRLFAASPKLGNTDQALQQLLQNILPGRNTSSTLNTAEGHRAIRNQLTQVLHQTILASLAKVQMQQLHSLSHLQLTADQPLPTQSWLMELPFKFGNEVHSVEIRIDDEWQDQEDDEGKNKKVRQWEVMLSFELPEMGSFYAHLKIIDDAVSAKLWAEQSETLKKAQEHLTGLRDQLTANGIEVTDLQCFQGQPEKKALQLGYSLVDVRT